MRMNVENAISSQFSTNDMSCPPPLQYEWLFVPGTAGLYMCLGLTRGIGAPGIWPVNKQGPTYSRSTYARVLPSVGRWRHFPTRLNSCQRQKIKRWAGRDVRSFVRDSLIGAETKKGWLAIELSPPIQWNYCLSLGSSGTMTSELDIALAWNIQKKDCGCGLLYNNSRTEQSPSATLMGGRTVNPIISYLDLVIVAELI